MEKKAPEMVIRFADLRIFVLLCQKFLNLIIIKRFQAVSLF